MVIDHRTNEPLEPTEKPEEFFEEMDDARRTGGKSCCTVWTLGLLLIMILALGLWVIFRL